MTGSIILSRLDEVRIIDLPCHRRDGGELVVAEAATGVPFAIARLFTLRAAEGVIRGEHAHRLCWQFMICVHGAADIRVGDGMAQHTFRLDRGDRALLVPPMIWNTVVFIEPGSVLAVLCDRPYEADDYVRDHAAFVRLRQGAAV